MPNINFYNQEIKTIIPHKRKLKVYLEKLVISEKHSIESLSIILCTDAFIKSMNQKYLGHDYETDILTFELSTVQKRIEGELYISIDTVKNNASSLHVVFMNELLRVIFHGVLHLCGYKDSNDKEAALIREKEDFYLSNYT